MLGNCGEVELHKEPKGKRVSRDSRD
jgi:hypothetical protein